MITFCFDRVADSYYGYPNLAQWSAEPYTSKWRQFDQHWPRSVPLRLLIYFRYNSIPYRVIPVNSVDCLAWYPIAFGWFDFECDYLSLISPTVLKKIQSNKIKILFYYHEGDNPERIKNRLDYLCVQHNLPTNCYIFISANTAADQLENFIYFPDHEFFFRHLNLNQKSNTLLNKRPYDFTMLTRTHKWWRATCTADLVHANILDNSLWSYNTDITVDDDFKDNPIEIDSIDINRSILKEFVNQGPYRCDSIDHDQQNDHHWVNISLYQLSNVHIVMETHFDADQSGGTFITEKTYKPIKFGQPFVIVGPPGTLSQLKKDGYRTFDSVIDSSYDSIENNTIRWKAIKKLLHQIKIHGSQQVFDQCIDDIKHNQEMFSSRSAEPLNSLKGKLLCLI